MSTPEYSGALRSTQEKFWPSDTQRTLSLRRAPENSRELQALWSTQEKFWPSDTQRTLLLRSTPENSRELQALWSNVKLQTVPGGPDVCLSAPRAPRPPETSGGLRSMYGFC